MPKFFVERENISDEHIIIKGDDAKHIKTVLRMGCGERLTVCDGASNDYECEIEKIEAGEVLTKIIEKHFCDSEPRVRITLFQGMPKSDKMELIIQKCVEIGVEAIVPVDTERAVSKLKEDKEQKKISRWQKISEAAAKQCGRGMIPKIFPSMAFKEALSYAKGFDMALIPYELEEETGLREALKGFDGRTIAVFIGPEGGFSQKEIELAQNSGLKKVTLGKRILRTETAGMVCAVILLYELD